MMVSRSGSPPLQKDYPRTRGEVSKTHFWLPFVLFIAVAVSALALMGYQDSLVTTTVLFVAQVDLNASATHHSTPDGNTNKTTSGDVRAKKKIIEKFDYPLEDEPSPYELRNPNSDLPHWAKKSSFFRNPVPEDKRVCFVHTGKAGGSTVGCSLGFQLHCGDHLRYPAGLLPQYTSHQSHNGVNDCPDDPAFYLFVIRNPLERIQSAYIYDFTHHNNPPGKYGQTKLYVDCPFSTLNDLAEKGLAETGSASSVCKRRAYNAIRGRERFGYHLYMNYGYYASDTIDVNKSSAVLVIRINHLQEDWSSAEATLGGSPRPVKLLTKNTGEHSDDEANRYLSDASRRLLCEALCQDIQVYKSLLYQAVNLTPEQVKTSMDELAESCPHEAKAKTCPKDSR